MKVGLIDSDGHNFPNYALMKISSYHKMLGDEVEWVDNYSSYDRVYIAKVFDFTKEDQTEIRCNDIIRGGTGYDINSVLPKEMEEMFPDYSIYPEYDYAVGYLSRGCPRKCPFCIVNDKEGNSHKVADLGSFYSGQKEIKLLDPNILACPNCDELLVQLINKKFIVDFTQGLDIRLLTKERLEFVKKIRVKRIHFAYDNKPNKEMEEKFKEMKSVLSWGRGKISSYVLVNYDTTIREDLHRIEFLKSLNITPYVMVYEKHKLPKGSIYTYMQQWCNRPGGVVWKCEFEQYDRFTEAHRKVIEKECQ